MATTAMVHVRVDKEMKVKAKEALGAMGLSISDAVRVLLTRVVAEKQLPFALKVPNAETRAAMEEADEIARTHRARFATATELLQARDIGEMRGFLKGIDVTVEREADRP